MFRINRGSSYFHILLSAPILPIVKYFICQFKTCSLFSLQTFQIWALGRPPKPTGSCLLSEQEEFAIGSKDTLEQDAQHFLQEFQMASNAEAPGNLETSIIAYGPLLIICKEIIPLGFLQARPKEPQATIKRENPLKGIQVGHFELQIPRMKYIVGISGYIHSQIKICFPSLEQICNSYLSF